MQPRSYRDAIEDVALAAIIFGLSFVAFPPEERGHGMHTLGMVLVGFNLGSAYVKAVGVFRRRHAERHGEVVES